MFLFRFLQSNLLWLAAVLLCALPIVVAVDFGGILRWTHYMSALVVVPIVVASCFALFGGQNSGGVRQNLLLLPLVIWLLFALAQTVPLSPGIVKTLSPASHVAYTEWLSPLIADSALPESFSISLAPHDSRHACAVLALVIGLAFAASMTFHTRARIAFLLGALSVGIAAHAGFGILRLALPSGTLLDATLESVTGTFGCFINRNNAAFLLNIGVACSLGLLSWRLMAMTGQEVDDDQFEVNDLASLVGDRESLIAVGSLVLCFMGLLLCGSRGGIVGMLAGMVLAFGWVRQRRGFTTLPVLVVAIGFGAMILLTPLNLSLSSIKRFDLIDESADIITANGRTDHWIDGFHAGVEHLPSGSGLSTYAYAHLPQQSKHVQAWAHHADNLWLELFTEQGIPGMVLAFAIFFVIVRSLTRLGYSPDPIDQGIRTTGWYLIGVIVVSQIFDFGLIIPANLFATVIVFAMVISRDASNGMLSSVDSEAPLDTSVGIQGDQSQPPGNEDRDITDEIDEASEVDESSDEGASRKRFVLSSKWSNATRAAIAVSAVLIPILALPTLLQDAKEEQILRSVRYQLKEISRDPQALKDSTQELSRVATDNPSPELLNMFGELLYRRGRLAEMLAMRPKSVDESEDLYESTKPLNRNRSKGAPLVGGQAEYEKGVEYYLQSLKVLPLGLEARAGHLYLDYVLGQAKPNQAALSQLYQLHRNNVPTLLRLGEYADSAGDSELATEMWHRAVSINPGWISSVIALSRKSSRVNLRDVLPDEPKSVRIASGLLMNNDDDESLGYLTHAQSAIECETCLSLEEKGQCLVLQGDIAYKLRDIETAFQAYQSAIVCLPTDANLRMKLISRYRTEGFGKDALIEARKARALISGDERFGEFIKKAAAEDIRAVEDANLNEDLQ